MKNKIILKQEDVEIDLNNIKNVESVEVVGGELILNLEVKK